MEAFTRGKCLYCHAARYAKNSPVPMFLHPRVSKNCRHGTCRLLGNHPNCYGDTTKSRESSRS